MRLILAVLLLLLASTAHAYIGPGAGIPVLGSLIGIVITIVIAIAAILFWPIRKMLKRGKNKAKAQENQSTEADTSTGSDKVVDAVTSDPDENK